MEIKIMYKLCHQNIIKLYNHFEDDENVYLIIEFAAQGQLWEKLTKSGRFDMNKAKLYMSDVISGIAYLHKQDPPIIHRDIKPENILIDAAGRMKICDFGWSNIMSQNAKR